MSKYSDRISNWRPVPQKVLKDPKPDRNLPLWSQKWKENLLQNTQLQRNWRQCPLSDDNAPINVFPQRGEGGHTGAIDIDVLPVFGASEQLLTQGSPQGRDY